MNNPNVVGDRMEEWLAENLPPELLRTPLPDSIANEIVEQLKQEADRHWFILPSRSLELATRIVAIGEARQDARQIALGLMAQGDALKFLGRYEDAWDKLDQAGKTFEFAGDEVGWARTRIGLLWLGLKLNRINPVLTDATHARSIFRKYGEQEKLLRLAINTAYVHAQCGNQHRALRLYHGALSVAESLRDEGLQHLGLIHMNIGFVHEALGNFPLARVSYEKARDLYIARNETRNIANIELNLANIAQAQGRYRSALRLLYGVLERGLERFPEEEKPAKRALILCFLYLNRFSEARVLAREIIDSYRNLHATYDMARTLLHLATAEAELRNFAQAEMALHEAGQIFEQLNATTWAMIARLRHGQVALKQGNLDVAQEEARAAASHFLKEGQQFNYATASLLRGQTSLAAMDFSSARVMGDQVLQIAQRYNIPFLRYAAYLLLGRVAETQSKITRAIRCYQAAAATMERVQRGLTITLRSGFLEAKSEAGRELVNLYLRIDKDQCAFEALERAKSQVLLSYVGDRDQFRWVKNDAESQPLLSELEILRAEHQRFYRLAHEVPQQDLHSKLVSPEQALEEAAVRERRMRTITEQLYLLSKGNRWANNDSTIAVNDVQQALDNDTLLIEYYNDGKHLWAFILDGKQVVAQRLPLTTDVLERLTHQYQANFATALQFDPQTNSARSLTKLGQLILQRLYSMLVEPLQFQQYKRKRLMIVPYGALHYLPFNLLYDGSAYLIERFEVVTLPAASLATRPGPKRAPGALTISHSWEGRLPQTQAEARLVHHIFGGTIQMEESASRLTLQRPPSQILHIAAHGQHRLDQPDLSFIELADGQLYADDLLQQDLSYELVTLSACETGRANVAADEELIGLGRGFLYAGAGALILSLWQVPDFSTIGLMEQLYRGLQEGKSKAAALREAQLSFLRQDRQLHPALWGAFQLIGDAGPLSTNR
jgi:CHAT domain-containing protein